MTDIQGIELLLLLLGVGLFSFVIGYLAGS